MYLLKKLSIGVLLMSMSVPSGFAKIYPDDFLLPGTDSPVADPAGTAPEVDYEFATDPFFFASDIPEGTLTRAEFIDAIATRLYDADMHDNCFANLVMSESADYELLFRDVSLDDSYASSVCVLMANGTLRGYSDGTFRPHAMMTAAEASLLLNRIALWVRPPTNRENWYDPSMQAIRSLDREFTLRPQDVVTGRQLRHTLCVLKRQTPQLDPLDEFTGC